MPSRLRSLTRPAWGLVFRRTTRGFVAHQLPDMAASLTYYGVLAIAPSLVALMSLGAIFGQGRRSADALLATIDEVAPDSALALLRGPLEQFVKSPSVGIALVVSLLLAIWATSSYVGAFGRAMNRIYEIAEGRPLWKLKPYQILVALMVIVLVTLTVAALVLSGPVTDGLADGLGLGETPQLVWTIVSGRCS